MKNQKMLKRILAVFLIWAVAFSLSGQAPEDLKKTIEGNSRFAFDMYRALAAEKDNLFFSPISISAAFSLLSLGAEGQTAEQLDGTFHYSLPRESRSTAFAELLAVLNEMDKENGIDLSTNNALWLQEGFPIHEEYIRMARDSYMADIFPVDYIRDSRRIFRMINRFAREKSRGMLQSALKEPLSPNSRLTLLSIIYFKGEWGDKFKKSDTLDQNFLLAANGIRKAKFMHQKNYYDYFETDDAQIIDIPYAGNLLSMVVFLPREREGLFSLEEILTADNMSRCLSVMEEELVDLYLPRFELMNEFDLKPFLGSLGTTQAFDPRAADFNIMENPPENQYISFARHGAAVKVSESGTEATAVTSAGGCFPGDTLVMTSQGLTPIDEIIPGTEVDVFDFSSLTWKQAQVVDIKRHDYKGDMVTIQSADFLIEATGNHPFYVLSGSGLENRGKPEDLSLSEFHQPGPGRWVEARELKAGDVLLDRTEGGLVLDRVSTARKNLPVYNLTINEHHNYAVTERAVLVHNKGSEEERGISFVADHPFAFLIRENGTGTILFMGRLMDPGK